MTTTVVGVPVLIGVVLGSRYPSAFEREVANTLLGLNIQPPEDAHTDEAAAWPRVRTRAVAPSTWRGTAHLLLQLPLGVERSASSP